MADRVHTNKRRMMINAHLIILLVLVWSEACIQQSNAQSTSTISRGEKGTVTLSCEGRFTFPEWRGPPSLLKYTISGDTTGTINSAATAASRLKYATNNIDLILSNAVIADSGDYQCIYTGGYNTITLTVNPAPEEEPPGTNTEDIAGGLIGGLFTVGCGCGCGYGLYFFFCSTVWYVFLTLDESWILGATIGACVVRAVTRGGPADGKLKVGFQIHKIDGKSLTGKDQNEIEAMIKDKTILTLHVSKVGSTDTSEVKLNCKRGEQLGFDCENLAIVTAVTEGGKAYKKLKKGDRILSINGKSTTGKSFENINEQLNNPPTVMELTLKRGEDKKHVTLDFKEKASSGIAYKKEKEDIVVSKIEPGSAAAISGEIQEQDCILSVNGVSTAGMKDADIIEMLKFSIILKVTKDFTLKELDPDKDGSFGFETFPPSTSISVTFNNQTTETSVTPDRPANVVKSVTPNGPAALQGIKPGDTIVSINGKKTKGKSHQEIKAMLETFGTSISLKIKENGHSAPVIEIVNSMP